LSSPETIASSSSSLRDNPRLIRIKPTSAQCSPRVTQRTDTVSPDSTFTTPSSRHHKHRVTFFKTISIPVLF